MQYLASQAINKLLTKLKRLKSTTIHGHMLCVQVNDKGMTKKWGKGNIKGESDKNRILTSF